jgi:hypothetical protein
LFLTLFIFDVLYCRMSKERNAARRGRKRLRWHHSPAGTTRGVLVDPDINRGPGQDSILRQPQSISGGAGRGLHAGKSRVNQLGIELFRGAQKRAATHDNRNRFFMTERTLGPNLLILISTTPGGQTILSTATSTTCGSIPAVA